MNRPIRTIPAAAIAALLLAAGAAGGAAAAPTTADALTAGAALTTASSTSAVVPCNEDRDDIVVFCDERYLAGGRLGQHLMDVYRPLGDDPAPVVIMVHGAGWKGGDKTGLANEAAYFARNGLAAVSVNYTLSLSDDQLGGPLATWPTAFEDIEAAVAKVQARAGVYGIDAGTLGTWGESAGGQLAALLHTDGTADIRSAVTLSGVLDLPIAYGAEATHEAIDQYLGCTLTDPACLPLAEDASPTSHVDGSDNPMLMFHSKKEFVPVGVAYEMQRQLDRVGVENELYVLSGTAHAAANECRRVPGTSTRVIDYSFTWLADDLLGTPIIPTGPFKCPPMVAP